MPDPAALAQAGPWAVVVAIGLGLGVAFVRGWIVAGMHYRDLQELLKILTDQVDRNSRALEQLASNEARRQRTTVRKARDA